MDDRSSARGARVSPALVGGILLLSAGGVLMGLGGLLTGVAAVSATRRWIARWEQPPAVVAKQRLDQARSAVAAGSRGWRDHVPSTPPASTAP